MEVTDYLLTGMILQVGANLVSFSKWFFSAGISGRNYPQKLKKTLLFRCRWLEEMWTNSGPTKKFPLNCDLCNNDEFQCEQKQLLANKNFPLPKKSDNSDIFHFPGIPYSVRRSKMLLFSKVNSSSCSKTRRCSSRNSLYWGWASKA